MWKFDLKRILIKKKGLIIIAAALILEFLSLRQSYSYRVDSEVEENKNLYMMYMEKYGGMADEGRYKELNEDIPERLQGHRCLKYKKRACLITIIWRF